MSVRVLQVLGRSAGGIARHVADIATGFAEDESIQVETAGPSDLPIEIPGPFHKLVIPDGPSLGHGAAVARIRQLVEGGRFDVVHAHGLRAGIDAGTAAHKAGKPSIATVHNLVHPAIAGALRACVYRYAERVVVRRNQRVFCVSAQIADHLRASDPRVADRVEVTYLGVADPPTAQRTSGEIRASLGLSPDTPLIVTVARLAPQKDLPTMFEAVAQLNDVQLLILGEGPLRESLEHDAARVGDRIRFLGFRDDVSDLVRAANVYCLSSVWEGVPLSAMEAIQVGVPVVGTDVGGMKELIDDRSSGRLVPSGDPAALAGALGEVLGSQEIAKRYAEKALADLKEKFDRRKMLSHLEVAYREAARA